MANKHCTSNHFNLVLIFLAAIVLTMLSTACNNAGSPNSGISHSTDSGVSLRPSSWVTVNIKFQPNTGEEQRDMSIKTIQRMLLNSVTPLMREYKNYYPSMKVTTTPFTDTLQCWISIINTYGTGTSPMVYSLSTGPGEPTCPQCPTTNPCRICDSLLRYDGNLTYGISKITIVNTDTLITK